MSETSPPVVLRFGDFVLDPQHFTLRRADTDGGDGETLHLQPKTFDLLHHLLRHPGRVLEKDELLAAVWPGVLVTEHSLTRCIKDLRRALGDDAAAPRYIETVAKRGYRLMVVPQAEAVKLSAADAHATDTTDDPAASAATAKLPLQPPPSPRAAPARRRWMFLSAAAVVVAGLIWSVLWRSEPAPVASIAVLPFSVLSSTAGDDAQLFADGVAEDVLDRLAQLPRLQVVARTSSFAFRGVAQDAKRIGRSLGVLWLLEGSVRRDGERVVVSAQLVDATSGYRKWSARFERPLADLFALQDEIARSVAAQVVQRIEPGTVLPDAHRSASVEAWQHYMLARELFNRRTQDWRPQARQALERALALEPGFARAQALWGIVVQMGEHGRGVAGTTPALAEQAVQRALAADPSLGLAHAADGFLRLQRGDYTGADAALTRALELDPMLVIAHNWRGIALTKQGRIAEADALLQAGLRIDPLNPVLLGNVGVAHERDGRPDDARRSYLRMLELPARPAGAYYALLAIDRDHGRLADALRWALAIEGDANARWGALAAVPALPLLAMLGMDEAALQRLQPLQGQAVPPAVFRAYEDALMRLGRHAEVEAAAQLTMNAPGELPAWWVPARAASLALRGQLPAALETLARRSSLPNTLSDGEQAHHRLAVAWAQLSAGDAAQHKAAQREIAQTVAQADAGRLGSNPTGLALQSLAHALAGDSEGALQRLERAQAGGFNDHRWLQHDPRWAVLRTAPRFQAVLAAAQAAASLQRDEVRRRIAGGDRDYASLAPGTPGKP